MFRGYLPALTVVVFGCGLGLGFSWSRGWIPLSLSPAKSGSLSIEVTQSEPLPPPNETESVTKRRPRNPPQDSIPDDPAVFEQQTEPDVDSTIAVVSKSKMEASRSRVIPAIQESEFVDESRADVPHADETVQAVPAKPARIPLRDKGSQTSETSSATSDVAVPRTRRSVTAVAHQDPTESANDAVKSEGPTLREQLATADEKLAAGETLPAHRILSKLYWNHKEIRPQIQDKLDANARTIFFQSQPHFVEPYVIQSGERLEVVAKKYQISWEYLAKLNRTEPRRIQVGQKLKVVKGPFGAVVDLGDFNLTVHLQGYYVKRYPVCTGKDGASPIGKFSVLNKVENPPYTGPDGKVIAADDPTNPLGERWIDLGDSYGIHGTIDPDSIGKAESRGCIRLGDREIIEVYNFLVKGSEVVIRK